MTSKVSKRTLLLYLGLMTIAFGVGLRQGYREQANTGLSSSEDALESETKTAPSTPRGAPKTTIGDLAAALSSLPSSKREPGAGSIRGWFTAGEPAELSGVTVYLRPIGTSPQDSDAVVEENSLREYVRRKAVLHDFYNSHSFSTQTDSEGRFEFEEIPNLGYRVEVDNEATIFVNSAELDVAFLGDQIEVRSTPSKQRTNDTESSARRSFVLNLSSADQAVDFASVAFETAFGSPIGEERWSPSTRRIGRPIDGSVIRVSAPGFNPVVHYLPHEIDSPLTLELQPECGLEVYVSGTDRNNGRLRNRNIYWLRVEQGAAMDHDLLRSDGYEVERNFGLTRVGPLMPGSYWVGLGDNRRALTRAISIEVAGAWTPVRFEVEDMEPPYFQLTISTSDDHDWREFAFQLIDRTRGTEVYLSPTSIEKNRLRLDCPSDVPASIIEGHFPGELELLILGPGCKAQVPVTSFELHASFDALREVAVTIAGTRPDHDITVLLERTPGPNDPPDYRPQEQEVSRTQDRVVLRTQPGRYRVQIVPRNSNIEIIGEDIWVKESRQEITLEFPKTYEVKVRVPEEFLMIQAVHRETQKIKGMAHRDSESPTVSLGRIPEGEYVFLAFNAQRQPSFMFLSIDRATTIDFVPVPVNALRLVREPLDESSPFKEGDLVVGVDGHRFKDYGGISEELAEESEAWTLMVLRQDVQLEIQVTRQQLQGASPKGLQWEPAHVP